MRIALYHPWIYVKSGLERTILEIVRRSRHDWDIHTSHYDAQGTYPELRDYAIRETSRVSVRRNYGAVLAASARVASTRLDLEGVDALVVCCDGARSATEPSSRLRKRKLLRSKMRNISSRLRPSS